MKELQSQHNLWDIVAGFQIDIDVSNRKLTQLKLLLLNHTHDWFTSKILQNGPELGYSGVLERKPEDLWARKCNYFAGFSAR